MKQQPRLNYKRKLYSAHMKGLEYPAWVMEEAVLWTLQNTYYIRPYYKRNRVKAALPNT